MRFRGILLGALLGAGAAMMLNRSGNFRWAALGNAGQALDQIVEMVRSRLMQPDNRSYYGSNVASNAGQSGQGLQQVNQMMKNDPEAAREVHNILSESGSANPIR